MSTDPFERISRPPQEHTPLANPITWIVVVIVVATAAGLYFWKEKADQQARLDQLPPQKAEAPPPAPPAPAEPQVLHPLPEMEPPPQAQAQPLPRLGDSDEVIHEAIRDALAPAPGSRHTPDLIITKDIARRVVATVDNLPRHKVAVRLLPVRPVGGQIVTRGEGEAVTLSPANYARYGPYVRLAHGLDAKQAVALYVHFYPLFQQAYEELGYPKRYFNDRLIQTIDDLLAAPDVQQPVKLVQPKVLYEFEDPELEDLSAGQKVLIRIGPDNAAVIKGKLREIRRELAAEAPALER